MENNQNQNPTGSENENGSESGNGNGNGNGNGGFILIRKETLNSLLKNVTRLSYMLLTLEYICSKKKLFAVLPANEVCNLLKIRPGALEDYRRRGWIKAQQIDGIYVYSAYDISVLAEKIRRRHRIRQINKIPEIQ